MFILCLFSWEWREADLDLDPWLTPFQEAYADYVKDYYLGSFGETIQTYDQENLKNVSVGEDSGNVFNDFQVQCISPFAHEKIVVAYFLLNFFGLVLLILQFTF